MRIVGEFLPLGDRATEEVADLAAILVDSRNEDMGGRLSGKLNDQFGQVGLDSTDTGLCQRLVEVNLVSGERLDFHHTVRTRSLHNLGDDTIGLRRITCPVDLSSGTLDSDLQLQQVLIEMVHDILKNDLAAGVLPCGRFGANAAWLRLAVLAHNVMTALKRLALPPELLSARPKRLRFLIFNTAGRLVRHARQMVLRLAAQRERLAEWIEALRLLWVPAPS